jgi:cytochrome c oxidase cbb3-type subunit 4
MDPGTLSGLVTAIMLLAFLGVVAWAYSARRREAFDQAALLPLRPDHEDVP